MKASAYVVGYTFIIDKIPCNITGVVTEKEQNEESIQEIKKLSRRDGKNSKKYKRQYYGLD